MLYLGPIEMSKIAKKIIPNKNKNDLRRKYLHYFRTKPLVTFSERLIPQ